MDRVILKGLSHLLVATDAHTLARMPRDLLCQFVSSRHIIIFENPAFSHHCHGLPTNNFNCCCCSIFLQNCVFLKVNHCLQEFTNKMMNAWPNCLLLLWLGACDAFVVKTVTSKDRVVTVLQSKSLLSDDTIARLQDDYRDLKDAFQFQANYFGQVTTMPDEITEDNLEQAAYLTHLQRFQQEQKAHEASEFHDDTLQDLQHAQEELQRFHESKLMQDFEVELAEQEEAKAETLQQQALQQLELLKMSEWDLKEALEELRRANDADQWSQAEMRKHEALVKTFKTRLIDHDPFKGSVAF